MKRTEQKRYGRPAAQVIEEATHLLRTAPAAVLANYYIGSVPFVLGLLYFWADMSRNPFAARRLALVSLGLALLFVWMKFWQVVFARKLRAHISGTVAPTWDFARVRRVVVAQMVWHPIGLFVLPVALLLTVPAGWTYAFFQNFTALDDGEPGSLRGLAKKSARLAGLWAGQNHIALLLLSLFGLSVAFGLAVFCRLLPELGKMLLGAQTVFTLSSGSLFNTTFIACLFGLTYLCVDPIVKSVYVLRCFYGEALQSGEDLKADLRRFSASPALASLVLLLWLSGGSFARAQETPPPPAPPTSAPAGVTPPELDRAIDDVIRRNKYTWRSPREKVVAEDVAKPKGAIARFLENAWVSIKGALKGFAEWMGKVLGWLFGRTRTGSMPSAGLSWEQIRGMLIALLALVVGFTIFFLLLMWRKKNRPLAAVSSEVVAFTPDLTDENVGAEQLPEDGWTRLARELLERGELRLALRAFYLASLAHLAERNLISLAKFKSNRDYERELARRGHSFAGLRTVFEENLLAFDRTWYGRHEATREAVHHFATNVEKIKAGG